LALGCMAAAADRGLSAPKDMAFVGFGGLGWGVFSRPSLTTVSLDADAMAHAVADVFKAREDGPAPPSRRVIPAKLVLRQSA
jgi:DNA-binding LacI/PurR family transcriptional regulator